MASKRRRKPVDLSNVTYVGVAHGDQVYVDYGDAGPERHKLDPRLDVLAISPTGYSWGSKIAQGPAQLALALLLHALGNETRALLLYQRFKWRVFVEMAPGESWALRRANVLALCDEMEELEREAKKHRPHTPEVAPINDRGLNVGLGGGKLVFEGDER